MRKSVAIASFVKTPSISPVKTRLAQTIGKEKTESFYFLSLNVITDLYQSFLEEKSYEVTPYWLVAEKEGLSAKHWENYKSVWQKEGNLGERLHHSYETLLAQHDHVVFLGMDSPQVTKEIILESLALLEKGFDFVFGPALDGGFYLFTGKSEIPKSAWTELEYSQKNTLESLEKNLKKIGKSIQLPTVLRDVDTEDDLRSLYTFWEEKHLSSNRRKIKEWIERDILK